eukprot:6210059-Pleurochrysis_carterae.AAC.2
MENKCHERSEIGRDTFSYQYHVSLSAIKMYPRFVKSSGAVCVSCAFGMPMLSLVWLWPMPPRLRPGLTTLSRARGYWVVCQVTGVVVPCTGRDEKVLGSGRLCEATI